jgi:hypothetical protein
MLRSQLLFVAALARFFAPAVQAPAQRSAQMAAFRQPGLKPAQQAFLQSTQLPLLASPNVVAVPRHVDSAEWTNSSLAWLTGGVSIIFLGLFSAKKASLAVVGQTEAAEEKARLASDLLQYRDVQLLPRTGEDFWTTVSKKTQERTSDFFNGEVLEMSVLLGNENTESKIPLRDLRLRFRRDPVASSELPGKSFLLEKVSDPWFISMDGRKEVEVEAGAWSLTPGLGSNGAEWGRLIDGRGQGKFCLRFWVDVKSTVSKRDVGLQEGTRLFFAINVIDKAELPNLHAQIVELGKEIQKYEESGSGQEVTKFQKWRRLAAGYDEYRMSIAKWRTLGVGVPTPDDEVVDLGGLYAHCDGVVGLVKESGSFFSKKRKQFGQAGTFSIRGQGDA